MDIFIILAVAFNSLMLLSIIILNLYYFFKLSNSKWKWIKLIYSINSGMVLYIISERFIRHTILNYPNNVYLHITETTLLVVTLFAGSIVSQAKLKELGINIFDDTKKLFKRGK